MYEARICLELGKRLLPSDLSKERVRPCPCTNSNRTFGSRMASVSIVLNLKLIKTCNERHQQMHKESYSKGAPELSFSLLFVDSLTGTANISFHSPTLRLDFLLSLSDCSLLSVLALLFWVGFVDMLSLLRERITLVCRGIQIWALGFQECVKELFTKRR